MRTFNMHCLLVASLAALCTLAGGAGVARGQATINFEAPTYTPGNIVGQDGWIVNGYVGTQNGTASISNVSPLSGAQSLSYTQTAAGIADIGKFDFALVPAGVAGTDVTLSYLIKATSNGQGSPNGGVFIGNGAPGGASPIFARLIGGVIEVGSAGAFVPVNSFFFLEGEQLKMTYEIDFDTSTMNLILQNVDVGDTFSQSYPFFAPYGAPTGPNGEYEVDLGIFLRGGNVQIDDIQLNLGVGPLVTEFEWTAANGSGNWNQGNNWTPTGIPGTLPGRQTATLGASITESETIYNNADRNLNALEINNPNSYVIAGTGSLAFQEDASGPTVIAPSITVSSGAHQIQLAVSLEDNTSINVSAGASLDLNNEIDLNGNTLSTSGTVRINHSTVGGGAVVSTGALAAGGAASIGGNLTSTGELIIGADADGADSLAVAGDATLSGILDVEWNPASAPAGSFAVVTAGGALDASGLALAAEDARSFVLAAEGNNLMLTFVGAVPEPAALALLATGLIAFSGLRRRRSRLQLPLAAVAVAVVFCASNSASAVSFNFENPPYTPGTLIGQDRWNTGGYVLLDPFFGGVVNGTVDISTSSPIAGAQSVLYTQTIDPPAAGGTGASDVGRPYSVFGVEDGTTAFDITASVQIRADSNSVGNGSVGFFLGRGGGSPILLLLTDANSTAGTGNILVGDSGSLPNVGTYVANNTYEFTFGVDLDNSNYEVTSRNITAGTPAVTLTGSGPGGRFPFFGGPAFPNDGDGVTTTLDTSLMLRSGVGRIDNITAVGEDFTEAVWFGGSGDWSNNPSWIPQMIPNTPTGNAQIAVFGSRATAPQTAFTNTVQTVNGLRFDNTNQYAIGGSGSITLKANTVGGTVNPTINVLTGAHEIQVPVTVLNNTAVTAEPGAAIDFNNTIALGGRTLSTAGAVDINVGVTGGGAISNTGTLGTAGATPIAANLTSTGTLAIDLGPANKDFFNITGTATLSGLLDVTLEPSFTPVGSYTVLTASGGLNAAGLALHSSDTSAFTLGVSGNSLVLTVGGTTSIAGDFDGDGTVDAADLAQWRGDFGGANPDSDADGDNDSDGNDFLLWQRNLGQSAAVAAATSVPEPSSAIVATAAAACAAAISRRHRRT